MPDIADELLKIAKDLKARDYGSLYDARLEATTSWFYRLGTEFKSAVKYTDYSDPRVKASLIGLEASHAVLFTQERMEYQFHLKDDETIMVEAFYMRKRLAAEYPTTVSYEDLVEAALNLSGKLIGKL